MAAPDPKSPTTLGALVGWKRHRSLNGNIICFQTAVSLSDLKSGETAEYFIALNTRQLRALSHDLNLAADEFEGLSRTRERKRLWPFR